jgi:surface polysaccharide O-acyltransferase-like enzyme
MQNPSSSAGGNANARLNALRGIAIIGVVAIHTSAHFTLVEGFSPVVLPAIVVDIVAHYAVPLFMLLSGIALALRYGGDARFSARSFHPRRLTKILPPYIVFSLLYMVLFTVEYGPPAASWIPLALLSGSAYYHLWFVALLIQLYLLFPLLRAGTRAATRRGAVAWLMGAALLLQLGWNLGAPLLRDALPQRPLFETVLSERFFLSHLFYFMLGVLAGMNLPRFEQRLLRLPAALLALTVAALTAGTAWVWTAAIRDYGGFGAAPGALFLPATAAEPLLFLATIALLWQIVTRVNGRSTARLERFGFLSFPIYLVHVFWQWALARLMAAVGLTASDWLFYVVMFVGTMALSYASAVAFTWLPYGELLTGAPRTPSLALPRKGVDSADASG